MEKVEETFIENWINKGHRAIVLRNCDPIQNKKKATKTFLLENFQYAAKVIKLTEIGNMSKL